VCVCVFCFLYKTKKKKKFVLGAPFWLLGEGWVFVFENI